MINYDIIIDAQATLVDGWGEKGKEIIAACLVETPFTAGMSAFLNFCTACGGNWGGMLLTGIKALYPNIYDLIPDNMGWNAWGCICSVLTLLGIEG